MISSYFKQLSNHTLIDSLKSEDYDYFLAEIKYDILQTGHSVCDLNLTAMNSAIDEAIQELKEELVSIVLEQENLYVYLGKKIQKKFTYMVRFERELTKSISDSFLKEAHKKSFFNRHEIEQSQICACFNCIRVFHPAKIERWIGETAVCPICNVDSVIPSKSGLPVLNIKFLGVMNQRYFGLPTRYIDIGGY
jgi:hypothetical protein